MTSTMMNENKIAQIKKLMERAENTTSEHEAEACTAKAMELAQQYNIELATARSYLSKAERDRVLVRREFTLGKKGQHGLHARLMWCASVAHMHGAQADARNDLTAIVLYGTVSQLDLLEVLFTHIFIQMEAATRVANAQHRKDQMPGRFSSNSFHQGYLRTVEQRVREAMPVEAADFDVDTATVEEINERAGAIALREQGLEVADFYRQNSRARGHVRAGSGVSNYGAYGAGKREGAKAVLGTQTAIG